MFHTLMELDSHPTVPSFSFCGAAGLTLGTLRHHKPNRMLKRNRSLEESDPDADRPSKRVAGLQEIQLNSGNCSRQNSEDWVQQTGGLSIDSPIVQPSDPYYFANNSNVIEGIGGQGPGNNMDEDIDMAEEAASPFQLDPTPQTRCNSGAASNRLSFLQQVEQRRSSMLNTRSHPYTWAQSSRIADTSSPMINIIPATPAGSQQSLALHETQPQNVNPLSQPGQTQLMLHIERERVATPPLLESIAMSNATAVNGTSFHQEPAPIQPTVPRRRITFGPRLDCEKCKQGEVHFAHFDYQ